MTTTHIGHKFDFTTAFTSEVVPVGSTFTRQFKTGDGGQASASYVFALNAGADSTAAGDVASCFSAAAFTYGSFSTTTATIADYTDGTTVRALVAGIAGAVIANGEYGWLWYDGYGTHAITTDSNVAIYNGLVCANGAKVATPNTTAASAHHAQFGISLAADASTTLSEAVLGGSGMFNWGRGV